MTSSHLSYILRGKESDLFKPSLITYDQIIVMYELLGLFDIFYSAYEHLL